MKKLKGLLKFVKPVLQGLFLIAAFGFMAAQAPLAHRALLRHSIQKKSVMITNAQGNHGGSGVNIMTPKGNKYILTNAHVCEVGGKEGIVYVQSDYEERVIPRKVIEKSGFTDLCLVEGLPNADYIKVGKEPLPGDYMWVVGHPRLYPTTMSQGENIGPMFMIVMDHIIESKEDKCNLPKNQIVWVDYFIWRVPVCTIAIVANQTNVTVQGGNSGSPIVDFYGNLVGLVFAGDEKGWAAIITVADINKFIAPY